MKTSLTLLFLLFGLNAFADRIELSDKTRIYERDSDYYSIALDKYVRLDAGTYLEVDIEDQIFNLEHGDLVLVKEVYDVDRLDSKKQRKRSRRLNNLSQNKERRFYISQDAVSRSRILTQRSYYESRRVDTSSYGYDRDEYTSCYANPVARIEYLDTKKAKRATNKKLIGLGVLLAGEITSALSDSDAGDIVGASLQVAGAGLYIYGAFELADTRQVIYTENGYDCRSYYQQDGRTYEFYNEGRQCQTKRYYSSRWDGTHEYFRTTCHGGGRYMSFNRRYETWGY